MGSLANPSAVSMTKSTSVKRFFCNNSPLKVPHLYRRRDARNAGIDRSGMTVARSSDANEGATSTSSPKVAMNGDLVTVHYAVVTKDGDVVESSRDDPDSEPLRFEVGAGEVVGNPLFETMDEAVRGCAIGELIELDASGGEWDPDLLFEVPRDHEEIQRLEGRYKATGGIFEGRVVELANGAQAMILEVNEEKVKLDANNVLAGQTITMRLEITDIEPGNR